MSREWAYLWQEAAPEVGAAPRPLTHTAGHQNGSAKPCTSAIPLDPVALDDESKRCDERRAPNPDLDLTESGTQEQQHNQEDGKNQSHLPYERLHDSS